MPQPPDCHVYDYWALDIRDYEHRGEREVAFITRPLKQPSERLIGDDDSSVHLLMDRVDQIDRQVGFPFAWFFLMTHGHWVEHDVGRAVAEGLRQQRVRLPMRMQGSCYAGRRCRHVVLRDLVSNDDKNRPDQS